MTEQKPLNTLRNGNDTLALVATVISACDETKGIDPAVLDVSDVFSLADYFVIVSGRSDRQVQGITHKILAKLAERNLEPLAVEGQERSHWVLIDCGEVIVHVFYEPVRAYYDLESLWHTARRLDIVKEILPLESRQQAA